MKVAIDITPLDSGHQYRGIGVYTKNLVEALKNLQDGNEYILTNNPNDELADVVHYPFFDLFFLTLPITKNVPTVVTIHDVIPLKFPQHYPSGLRGKVKLWWQKQSLKGASAIITDSDVSKADIEKYLKMAENKIHRVYLAADENLTPMSRPEYIRYLMKYDLDRPYLLYVGDINFNKNIPGLIGAYQYFSEQMDLVMVSKAMGGDSEEAANIKQLINSLKLEEKVRLLTNVPFDEIDDMRALYSGATAYIQSSYYEGFGLPILEAMKCMTPVVTSEGGSLKEIAGNGAIMFDTYKDGSLVKAIKHVLNLSVEERNGLIKKGMTNARRYSWEKTAKNTVKVYERIVK